MKRSRLLRWMQNQSLHKKMIYIIIFSCLTLLTGNYVVLQMAYYAYDEQLYTKTAQVFTAYVEQIETEFEKMDNVTLSMIGNVSIQNNLTTLRDAVEGSTEWLAAMQALETHVGSYRYDIDYFSSLGIYPVEIVGRTIGTFGTLGKEDKAALAEMAIENGGASQIVIYNERIYFIRHIREAKNYVFNPLGTIIGEINLQKLLDNTKKIYETGGGELDLSVYVEDVCVYQKDDAVKPLKEDGWQIQDNNFVVQCTTERNWKILMYTSYDMIHDSIRTITINSFLWFAFSAIVVLLISYFLVAQITHHLDRLMNKIDAYGKGELPAHEDMQVYTERRDEIGRLHRHFDRMAYEYKQLNEENYNQMLLQKETQYKQLQQQIQPHFIYNTLSLIAWKAYESHDTEVAKLTNALSRMMRQSLSFSETTVTVKEELKLVEDYMLIQCARYKKRLNFKIEVSAELESVRLPQMTIQPIVENAVKYALEEMLEPCVIRVKGRREDQTAILIVEDNGFGVDENIIQKLDTGEIKARGNGIGLRNIQKRIQLIFPEQYGLEFHRIEERTQVWIRLPYESE